MYSVLSARDYMDIVALPALCLSVCQQPGVSLSVSMFVFQYQGIPMFLCMWDCGRTCTYLYRFVSVGRRRI